MSTQKLLTMLRHTAEHSGMHHVAALSEMRDLDHLSDAQFRAQVLNILDAVTKVDDEIDEPAEEDVAVAR